MRFWSTPPHQSIAETEKFVRNTIKTTEEGRGDDFVVLYQNRVVGKAGLWDNQEIGFIFSPSVWGMGIASEAVQAILKRAAERGIPKVLADVDPRNERSIRLLTKNGFVETGRKERTMQVGDEWVDSVYFEANLNTKE